MCMDGVAFCPAHITGFFQAMKGDSWMVTGSIGAGFSIAAGVTTKVRVLERHVLRGQPIPRHVAELFLSETGNNSRGVEISHAMGVPSGYGLGTSGALALSTAYALDRAFGTGLRKERLGQMAHRADMFYKSGLGDVLAAYHGGFEIRTKAGAPGYGSITNLYPKDVWVFVVCISPLSTKDHLDRMDTVGDLGERMVTDMLKYHDMRSFQNMSLEFARRCDIVTPMVEGIVQELDGAGVACGMALFGQTLFTIVPHQDVERISTILGRYKNTIRTRIDSVGARVL